MFNSDYRIILFCNYKRLLKTKILLKRTITVLDRMDYQYLTERIIIGLKKKKKQKVKRNILK